MWKQMATAVAAGALGKGCKGDVVTSVMGTTNKDSHETECSPATE